LDGQGVPAIAFCALTVVGALQAADTHITGEQPLPVTARLSAAVRCGLARAWESSYANRRPGCPRFRPCQRAAGRRVPSRSRRPSREHALRSAGTGARGSEWVKRQNVSRSEAIRRLFERDF
jgi:hypothetical protein